MIIYDLGGGTLDVTVMCVEGNKYTTLSTDGDTDLGGADFDNCFADYCFEEFKKENGTDLRLLTNEKGRRAANKLRKACSQAKIDLSTSYEANLELEFGGNETDLTISRSKWENLNDHLF